MANPNPPPVPPENPPVAPALPDDLANALLVLAQAMAANNANTATIITALTAGAVIAPPAANAAAPAVANPGDDPIFEPSPLDLSSRTGLAAYAATCAKLDETWDGSANQLPAFVAAIRSRVSAAYWNAGPPHGITRVPSTTINNHFFDLLADYNQVDKADITTAGTNRTDRRAKQNATAMYRAIKLSLEGDIKATLLQQIGNSYTVKDGVDLFYCLTQLTGVLSLQLSLDSVCMLIDFAPGDYNFSIPQINTRLNHLFLLATTCNNPVTPTQRLLHTEFELS
jgi:uncharacterized protein YdcH (DUF465 family)